MDKETISNYMSMLGKKSAKKLTKEERKARSLKAIRARWNKKKVEHIKALQ